MKFFSLIYQGEVHPSDDKKVIEAKDYSNLYKATEILRKAKEDVKKYQEDAEEKAKELHEKAKEDGFNEGLVRFNEHILKLDSELKNMRQEMQKKVLTIALQAAKKIVGQQLDLHPDTIVDIVIQVLKPFTQSHFVTIYVSKDDKQILDKSKKKIKDILDRVETLSIQTRDGLSPGSCIIETEKGIINAEIENQWTALNKAFAKFTKE